MSISRIIRSSLVGGISNWSGVVQLLAAVATFCGGGALLSLAASSIEGIMHFGWGAAVFAGLSALCGLALTGSLALVAWRYFRPLPPLVPAAVIETTSPLIVGSNKQIEAMDKRVHDGFVSVAKISESQNNLIARISQQISQLSQRTEALENILKPKPTGLLTLGMLSGVLRPNDRFGDLDIQIGHLEKLVADKHSELLKEMEALNTSIRSDRRQSLMQYEILATSLRARDAAVTIKAADEIILNIGRNLLNADNYENDDHWANDYQSWHDAIERIDSLLLSWSEHHHPFLDIHRSEYENAGYKAPLKIVSASDTNSIRLKTVRIVQPRYANQRDNILQYFHSKSSELFGQLS